MPEIKMLFSFDARRGSQTQRERPRQGSG